MARIAIISDTHGSIENLKYFSDRLGPVDSLFHLGDVTEDAPRLARMLNCGFVSVRGNCDPWARQSLQEIVTWHGNRILLVHGHLYPNPLSLLYKAQADGCNFVCSGHTHVAALETYNGVTMLNPGSLSRPRSSKGPSCAILTVLPDSISAELLFIEP